MVAGPASIEGMGEPEKPIFGRGGLERLPRLILVTRSAECDDSADFLVFGESGCGR